MRYLLLSSCLFVFAGCTSSYKQLQKTEGSASCIEKFRPKFTTALYTTRVNIIGNYLTGLLVIKTMPDSSTRLVFTSEMGLSLFDFEFKSNGDFKVHHIINKMNRKAVIKTLRQDFELVLMQHLNTQTAQIFRNNDRIYHAFSQENGSKYYITGPECRELIAIEKASKRKALVQAVMKDYTNGIPDTIGISHTNFHFTIGLKRLER
ncbi:MAG TPA: hypothetical protein VFN95_00315 [Flavitalea sp.]|nr:hypothetical protein [Flavitalea sp.]